MPTPMGRNQGRREAERKLAGGPERTSTLEATATSDATLEEELNRIDLMGERFLSPSPQLKALNDVARSLDVSRESLVAAMSAADEGELSGIHMRLASIVAEVDSLASDLAGGEAA
jgi:hypothetical protein